MKDYRTTWIQGNKRGVYKTKSLTDFHKSIHENPKVDYARTVETDSSVVWPFGLYAEIIALTDKSKPSRNKKFSK